MIKIQSDNILHFTFYKLRIFTTQNYYKFPLPYVFILSYAPSRTHIFSRIKRRHSLALLIHVFLSCWLTSAFHKITHNEWCSSLNKLLYFKCRLFLMSVVSVYYRSFIYFGFKNNKLCSMINK